MVPHMPEFQLIHQHLLKEDVYWMGSVNTLNTFVNELQARGDKVSTVFIFKAL